MSLIASLKSIFAGQPSHAVARETNRVYVVDAEKLAESRENQGRMGPVERFQAIQLLSRFAEREKVEIVAVVGGRPLREVAHGEAFNKVRVFYVEANATMADQIQKVISGELRGRKPVVITNDKQLETRLMERSISTMRVATFRKAFENGNGEGEQGGRSRDRGDRRQRRGPRPDRQDRQQQQREPQDQGERSAERPQADEGQRSGSDTVDNLIDRID